MSLSQSSQSDGVSREDGASSDRSDKVEKYLHFTNNGSISNNSTSQLGLKSSNGGAVSSNTPSFFKNIIGNYKQQK